MYIQLDIQHFRSKKEKKIFVSVSVPFIHGCLGALFYKHNDLKMFPCCSAEKPPDGEHYLETQNFSVRISIGEKESDQ